MDLEHFGWNERFRSLFESMTDGDLVPARVIRVDLLRSYKGLGLALVREIEPMPVDHRTAAQQDADGLEVGQGEFVEAAELGDSHS